MKQLRKFLSLTHTERQLFIKAFVLLALVRLGMWLLPFKTLQRLLAIISQGNAVGLRRYSPTTDQIVEAVNRSSCYLPGNPKCLARALTTQTLMSQCRYSAELRIGVAKGEQGQFEAHAWVESQGQIVIGDLTDLSRFTPMSSLQRSRL
ncbi:MAG: lasso peptide biosynthesis B2 protein [Moorea sp. SIO4G2]|uniref:lasso peptide biosynthesis B2 protein n=1 Tax=unclassified Moorena TaxID=2683338 RepID=UPI0013FCDD20|nr:MULTISPECIES: lasso peptide biosynthesis B2 protein [unclassified Moorena]NEO14256.1 lasso peptide biosynthesis B2 protein [Moorena sp. SIO3E8]NEO64046.1 lasso peptide biosynthesis B2 protein [Moorena sp. SIO4G2]NEQ00203.1 lasso peptide biosynthesis B2 protein [Moorena sp. SIO3F7]